MFFNCRIIIIVSIRTKHINIAAKYEYKEGEKIREISIFKIQKHNGIHPDVNSNNNEIENNCCYFFLLLIYSMLFVTVYYDY